MKKLLLIISMVTFTAFVSNAQVDTILYENFDVDPTASYSPINNGNDTVWVNFDSDALPDANARPQEWFWSEGGVADVDTADPCLFSSSWLTGFLPGNRNYLITPPVDLTNVNGAELSWEAAPRQTPLYVDGYSVLVSTTDNIESSFTDTLFRAAQYEAGSGFDFSAYTFSQGFVHGEDGTYIQYDPTSDSSRFIGELRPFTASLAQYQGQVIYIAFLHDSDDDNLIMLDDIMITGTIVGINESAADVKLNVYPNPASNYVDISYTLGSSNHVVAFIYDVKGNKVYENADGMKSQGIQKQRFDTSGLASGLYNIVLTVDGDTVSKRFVKN